MKEKEFKSYVKAGKVLKRIQSNAKTSIKEGMKLLDIAEKIEKEIIELDAKPAFPANLSLNNNAAHYTPASDDETVIGEKDLLKVDIGVHVDGFIADASITIDFSNEWGKMAEATEKALENALSMLKVGRKLGEIGTEIEKTIRSYGFNPVQNLSGHGLAEYQTHASPSIPNISKRDARTIEEGKAYAVEPFATNGSGFVKEAPQTEIFELNEVKPVRNLEARKILSKVEEEYNTLPFAQRWLLKSFSPINTKIALRELIQRECLKRYPLLREQKEMIVTQAENSFVVHNEEIVVLV